MTGKAKASVRNGRCMVQPELDSGAHPIPVDRVEYFSRSTHTRRVKSIVGLVLGPWLTLLGQAIGERSD